MALTHQNNHHAKDHQFTNQKALWQAVQFSLQQKNHHAPDIHTVAPRLCTVVFSNHRLWIEYSLTQLSMLQALIPRACHPHYKKHGLCGANVGISASLGNASATTFHLWPWEVLKLVLIWQHMLNILFYVLEIETFAANVRFKIFHHAMQ